MENSINESEAQQSFRSPPRRRRSTFFERRDSIIPNTISETINVNNKDTGVKERQTQDLNRYYQKLLAEKEMWKKEVNERRNKYHDLRQQYQIAVKASSRSRISYSALSTEDIEFLKAKPNLSKLVDSQQKLHKSVLETRELFRRASELDNVILMNSEDMIDSVTNYILENSTLDIVE
ncbi:unnamed protein product [Arctia plantaginis]|uniref:Uncharacterized protein n=1 Tax=Arctia plantaginis TaxID=874455 RepID=A0A8S1BQ00_ARCPL|nr:unnamed protein product [Arctia plantaginis]CAB3259171.1 unnamed protein product [Arctia plantaginis]